MKHTASCNCGQLKLMCNGEIKRTSICHCYECQKRTGSVFGVQLRFEKKNVQIEGTSTEYIRIGDEGSRIQFHFCPKCGSTIFWYIDVPDFADFMAIAAGAFADRTLPAPIFSVYEDRMHPWVILPPSIETHLG